MKGKLIVKRKLSTGAILEIRHIGGTLIKAFVDGAEKASGGLTKLRSDMPGFAMLACGKVPVTSDEAANIERALSAGRAEINARLRRESKYNDLFNEGEEGYTPF